MSKKAKQFVTDEYRRWYAGVQSACVVDLTGLDAIATHRLRGHLRQKKIQLHVIRNSLARRALAEGPLGPIAHRLNGPCALVTGGNSIVEVAKELVRLAGDVRAIKLKFGLMDGETEVFPIEHLAKMKSRQEVQGELVMLILSPWRRVASQVTSPWRRVAGCVKTLAEEAGKEQAA